MVSLRRWLSQLSATGRDLVERAGDPEFHEILRSALQIAPRGVARVLPWLYKSRPGHDQCLMRAVMQNAALAPDELAIEMGERSLSWAELDATTSKIAHVLAAAGVRPGEVVVLLGSNSPDYLAITLAISRVGAVTSLINSHLRGGPLAHALRSSRPRLVLCEQALGDRLAELDELPVSAEAILHYHPGELDERCARAPAGPFPRARVDAGDDYLYIFTSGTTGLPKPCRVSHGRALLAGMAFGTLLFDFTPGDKLYCVLPLYHSSAMLIGTGSAIMTRTPIALRQSFSASAFWPDVQRYGATAMLYIGELCRYLVNTPPCEAERDNPLRVAVGNGLRAEIWQQFQDRFDIADIREFYSATEAPGIIANITNKVGSIGHVPARRLGALRLARYDVDRDELERDAAGYCIPCEVGEVGELLIHLKDKPASALGEFKGYTDEAATARKQLRDVFEPGDRYFASGDLMRFDETDYFYFVDRIGDTYRWKGENVSTEEVAEVLATAPGVKHATVSGVRVPGAEGQAGLAALVCDGPFDSEAFWQALQQLPGYAQPRFVRLLGELDTTGTFKIQKSRLRAEGIDPQSVEGSIFVRSEGGYLPLTTERYQALLAGQLRL